MTLLRFYDVWGSGAVNLYVVTSLRFYAVWWRDYAVTLLRRSVSEAHFAFSSAWKKQNEAERLGSPFCFFQVLEKAK